MDGSALEVALALMRTPSMRVALRGRPLPDGVGEVIELAAGAPARVANAAARVGETPADVREAARFYVREVLLFAGADAYRVLGVAVDADDARVKLHHRHLQQWLHPDRDEQGWESAFAARVNMAWAELRSPSRRAAYDARRALQSAHGPDDPRRVLVSDWRPTQAVDDQRWRRWVLPIAAVACCMWLVVLAMRQTDAPGPQWHVSSGQEDAALELPESTIAAVAAVASVPVGVAPRVEAGAGSMIARPTDDVLVTLRDSDAAAVRSVAMGNPSPPNPSGPAQRAGRSFGPHGSAAQMDRRHPLEGESHARAVSDEAGDSQAASSSVKENALAPGLAHEEANDIGAASVEADAGASPTPVVTVSPQRVRLVHRVARDLTTYLAGDARRAPPIWNSAAAQDVAASLRKQFDGARFGDADWRVDGERASMRSAIERRGPNAGSAVLRAEFTWREGLWLVDGLAVEDVR
jgi:hypothetical protein